MDALKAQKKRADAIERRGEQRLRANTVMMAEEMERKAERHAIAAIRLAPQVANATVAEARELYRKDKDQNPDAYEVSG